MSDTISRQAVIESIQECADAAHRNHEWDMEQGYRNAIECVEEAPSAQPGWIPCSRELPKPNEEDGNGFHKAYLVQDGRWMDVARWDGKYWIAWGYSTVLLNVVAWCELPKPWEGVQDNGKT